MKPKPDPFGGLAVPAAALKLAGNTAHRVGSLDPGEEIFVVVKAVVTDIGHGDKSGIFTRTHTAKAVEVALVDADAGARMLEEALALADERFGVRSLFHQGQEAGE